jgi:hypothetical protein
VRYLVPTRSSKTSSRPASPVPGLQHLALCGYDFLSRTDEFEVDSALGRAGAAFMTPGASPASPSKPLATGGKRDRRLQVCKTASVVHRLEGSKAVPFAVQGVRVVSDWHPSFFALSC